MSTTSQTFNVSLPKALVQKADRVAKLEYRNRSELIREALRMYIQELEAWDTLFSYGSKQASRKKLRSEADVVRAIRQHRRGR